MWGQYTNNSCVPDVALPCSDDGFPAFAVNATTTQHVKLAVDFGNLLRQPLASRKID